MWLSRCLGSVIQCPWSATFWLVIGYKILFKFLVTLFEWVVSFLKKFQCLDKTHWNSFVHFNRCSLREGFLKDKRKLRERIGEVLENETLRRWLKKKWSKDTGLKSKTLFLRLRRWNFILQNSIFIDSQWQPVSLLFTSCWIRTCQMKTIWNWISNCPVTAAYLNQLSSWKNIESSQLQWLNWWSNKMST